MQGLQEVAQDIAGEKKLSRNTISIMAPEGQNNKKDKKTSGHGKGN